MNRSRAPIHDDDAAIDEPGLLRGKKQGTAGNIRRFAELAVGVEIAQLGAKRGVVAMHDPGAFTEDRAWADGIHPDSKMAILLDQDSGKRQYSAFSRRVGCQVKSR